MWRERIIEEMNAKGISKKTMAERMQTTEKTVKRLLSDDSKTPYITTVLEAGAAVDLSPQELFAETGLIIGDKKLAELQEELTILNNELKLCQDDCDILQERADKLTAENEKLRTELAHKEELLALHDRYLNLIRKMNNKKMLRGKNVNNK